MSTSGRVVGFSREAGVDRDDTFGSRFSQKEQGELVDVAASVFGGFDVHERDSHAQV